jgi:flagellar basal-body rod modification protein FlgD
MEGILSSLPLYEPEGAPKYADKNGQTPEELRANFLSMLTTQLQNQDPLSPMDNAEFTGQMAQFTGLEQQQTSNMLLEKLLQAQNTNQLNSSVGYIGRQVMVEGDQMTMSGGMGQVNFRLDAPANAKVTVTDANGKVVQQFDAGLLDADEHKIDIYDPKLADGTYKFHVTAESPDGSSAVKVTHMEKGIVQGVSQDGKGTVKLDVNGRSIGMAEILRVEMAPVPFVVPANTAATEDEPEQEGASADTTTELASESEPSGLEGAAEANADPDTENPSG